ncbi:MAG: hypothetical protein MZV70_30130 [Desulfobacterales bacterium]|nr:hypothetical protein [Desulfobacterales bacterium]
MAIVLGGKSVHAERLNVVRAACSSGSPGCTVGLLGVGPARAVGRRGGLRDAVGCSGPFCFARLGSEFLPKMDDGRIVVKVQTADRRSRRADGRGASAASKPRSVKTR